MAAVVGKTSWSDVLYGLVRKFDFISNAGALRKLYKPLYIEDRQVGLVRPDVLEHLAQFPQVFVISNDRVDLHPTLQTYDERSAKVNDVLQELRQQKCLKTLSGWRNECYEVRPNFEDTPLMKMDRCATCLFGIKQYGVDINGYVRNGKNGDSVWIQRRAYNKQTWPGKLDNMVSGGVAVGFTVMDTVKKEAEEEASIPPYLIERLTPAGAVTFYFEDDRGLFLETEFVFDLELPADFVPVNADGEVEDFQLITIDELKEKVVSSEFKTTSCPVTIDFLVRRGYLTAENEPNYGYICEKLHMPVHNFFNTSNGVTQMLRELNCESLSERRFNMDLNLFTKILMGVRPPPTSSVLHHASYIGRRDHLKKLRELYA